MKSLSPEIRRVPLMVEKFRKSGLLQELIRDALLTESVRPRNFIEDMRTLSEQQEIAITGLENIPSRGGGLIIFNHPEVHIIAPAIFNLPVAIQDAHGRSDFSILMGAELPFFGGLSFPGSEALIRRLSELYPNTFILVPSDRHRSDYHYGREQARLDLLVRLETGHLVAYSPEAQVSKDGSILPESVYRRGAGAIGIIASRAHVPIIPVGVWQEPDHIQIVVGPQFGVGAESDPVLAVRSMMKNIASLMPENLRGPYRS